MRRLIILGAGGHGAVVADCALASAAWDRIAFLDDSIEIGSDVVGLPVQGAFGDYAEYADGQTEFFVAIGDNGRRLGILDQLTRDGIAVGTLVHPTAYVGNGAVIGDGSVVLANAVVNTRASVGRGVIVNTSAVVEHDCAVGDGVHVSPGACIAGGSAIGEQAWIGLNASVLQSLSIGARSIVGAGAVVVSDLPAGKVAVGVPARVTGEAQ